MYAWFQITFGDLETPKLALCWYNFLICLCKFCFKVWHMGLCGFYFASFWVVNKYFESPKVLSNFVLWCN
jgi:hypothetical protein